MNPDKSKRQKSDVEIMDAEAPKQVICRRTCRRQRNPPARIRLFRITTCNDAGNHADMAPTPSMPPAAASSATIISPPTSTKSIDDVPYYCFCLANKHLTTQCPDIPPQLCSKIFNKHETNVPSIARGRRQNQWNIYCERLSMKYGSIPTTKRSMKNSHMHPPAHQPNFAADLTRCRSACDATLYESLNAQDYRTVTFPPIDRLPDDGVSDVMQSNSSNIPQTHSRSVTTISKNIDLVKKTDVTVETSIRFTPRQEPYSMVLQYDEESHDVASFFRKSNYCGRNSVGAMSSYPLAVARLLDMGTSLNSVNEDFLPRGWKESINHISRQHYKRQIPKPISSKASCLLSTHCWFTRMPLIWHSRKPRRWRIAQERVYRPMNTRDIPNEKQSVPFACDSIGDYYNGDSEKLELRR